MLPRIIVSFKPHETLYLIYRKVVSSNTSRLEAHAGFFQIAYEGNFLSLSNIVDLDFGLAIILTIPKSKLH